MLTTPIKRGEITGFYRAARRLYDARYPSDFSMWNCDCYCGQQLDEIPESWLLVARNTDPSDDNQWMVCACGNELQEIPLGTRADYDLCVAKGYQFRNFYHPHLLASRRFAHFRLAYIAATFPPHWNDNGRSAISRKLRGQVYSRDGYKCQWCSSTADLTVDHVEPVANGGPTILWNLQTLCRSCNARKGTRVMRSQRCHVNEESN